MPGVYERPTQTHIRILSTALDNGRLRPICRAHSEITQLPFAETFQIGNFLSAWDPARCPSTLRQRFAHPPFSWNAERPFCLAIPVRYDFRGTPRTPDLYPNREQAATGRLRTCWDEKPVNYFDFIEERRGDWTPWNFLKQ